MNEQLEAKDQSAIQQLGIEEQMFNPPQQDPQEPPQTIVIECNKQHAVQDGSVDSANEWTNTFPSVKLKKGDLVSVNSAFLSSRGSGDLLQFDSTNNKTRVIFEYYCSNDGANGKRPAYNIKGNPLGQTDCFQMMFNKDADGNGYIEPTGVINCHPNDYRPMKLFRLMKTFATALPNRGNVAPYTTTNPAPTPPYDGSQLDSFTDTTTKPPSALMEANWGFEIASNQINEAIEDDYVPGLLRNPTVNIRETVVRMGDPTPNPSDPKTIPSYWGHSYQNAKIWYISTPRSQISPAGGSTIDPRNGCDQCMRIHFAYGNTTPPNILQDSLAMVKSFRPGMIIKFIDPDLWGGLRCPSYILSAGQGAGEQAEYVYPGSNAYYCSGYASENQGYSATVDKFTQIGNLQDYTQTIHQPAWIGSPLQGFFKITRVYINASAAHPGGNNSGGNTLDFCPYIEVMGNTSISLAWGNPNLNMGENKPDILGVNFEDTGANYKYNFWRNMMTPANIAWCRTWIGQSMSVCQAPTNQGRGTMSSDYVQENCDTTAGQPYIVYNGGMPDASDASGFLDASKLLGRGIGDGNGQFATSTIPFDAVVTSVQNGDGTAYTQTAGVKRVVMSKNALKDQAGHQIWIFTRERELFRDSQKCNIFPEIVGNEETFYLGFEANIHQNDTGDALGSTGIYHPKTAEVRTDLGTMSINTEANFIANSQTDQFFSPINYNFQTLGQDLTYNDPDGDPTKLKYGIDYYINLDDHTETYAGGRLPKYYNRDTPTVDSGYDESNYITCKRTNSTNLGAYMNNGDGRTFNNLTQYSSGATLDGGNVYLNPDGKVNLPQSAPAGNRGMDFFPFNTPAINQSSWYLEGHAKGVPTQFYFALPIASSVRAGYGYTGMNLPFVTMAERGLLAEIVDYTQPYFQDGTINFLGATKNFENARFYNDPYDQDRQVDRGVGGFFGYEEVNAHGVYIYNDYSYSSRLGYDIGSSDGAGDMRYVASQIEQSFVARFTNTAGETEMMAIQMIGNGQIDWNAQQGGTQTRTIDHRTGAIMIEPKNAGYTAAQKLQRDCQPGFIIVQRDLMGTGLKSFEGNSNQYLNPQGNLATQSWCIDKGKALPHPQSYFEIVDCLASTEHTFEFDSKKRELISMSCQDIAESKKMTLFSTAPAPAGGNPTVDGGGQFILTKIPNMPIVKDGKIRYNDMSIHMIDQNISQKVGEDCPKPAPQTPNTDPALQPLAPELTPGHQGNLVWLPHYDFIDLDLSQAGQDVFYSPTDISNLITNQLQAPSDLFNSKPGSGGKRLASQLPNTAGQVVMNSLYRPIHSPNFGENKEDGFNGCLAGSYQEGTFCFFKPMTNAFSLDSRFAFSWMTPQASSALLDFNDNHLVDGVYPVWPANDHTYLNTAPTTNAISLQGFGYEWTSKQAVLGVKTGLLNKSNFNTVNYNTLDACCASQFVGAYKPQLIFNEDVSRFEWQYLHQPVYSDYDLNSNNPQTEEVVKIWGQNISRCSNWSRYGGINVVNWCADSSINFNTIENTVRQNYVNPLDKTQPNSVSLAFMNKLGFSSNWINDNAGETVFPDTATDTFPNYLPLGTTDANYNLDSSISYAQDQGMKYYRDLAFREENINDPSDLDASSSDKATALDAVFVKMFNMTMIANTNIFGGLQDQFGNEDTAHPPAGYKTEQDAEKFNPHRTVGASVGYGFPNTFNTPKAWKTSPQGTNASTGKDATFDLKSRGRFVTTDMNFDDVKFPYRQVAVQSSGLRADLIPSKTDTGYFLIMSDLIDKHEFYGSANGGQPLNCIGILSKNYENNDFYFSFQSPVEFFIKHDKPISQITTRIVTPSLKEPVGLDFNSSVIYTVTRSNNIPEPDVPPIPIQQAYDYALQNGIELQMGLPQNDYAGYGNNMYGIRNMPMPSGSRGGGSSIRNALSTLSSARQSLVQSVLNPSNNTASAVAQYNTELGQNLGRLSMRGRVLMAREGFIDPSAEPPEGSELYEAEQDSVMPPPALVADGTGLSTQELEELDFDLEDDVFAGGGKKPESESGVGTSIFTGEDDMRSRRSPSPEPRTRKPINMGFEATDDEYDRMSREGSIGVGDIAPGLARRREYERQRIRSLSQEPQFASVQEYLGEAEKTMRGDEQRKFKQAIREGVSWDRIAQIPTSILRLLAKNTPINSTRLAPGEVDRYKKALEERGVRDKGGVPIEKPQGILKGVKPTQPKRGKKAQGGLTLQEVLKGTAVDSVFDPKTENKHDMRTWRKGLLVEWDRHRESALAPYLAGEAEGSAIRERHKRGQSSDADKAYLTTFISGSLYGKELERRLRKGEGKMKAGANYKQGKPDSKGRRAPTGYNSKVPQNSPRGVQDRLRIDSASVRPPPPPPVEPGSYTVI